MKTFLLIIIILLSTSPIFSQDATWIKDISTSVGLDSAYGARVFSVDVNGDNYPDLLYTGKTAIRNTLKLYLNIEKESNPNQRVFVDITEESGINAPNYEGRDVRWSDVAGFADFDNDGDMDLMTCTYFHRLTYFATQDGIEQGHYSEVLLNDGNGHFTIKENSGMHDIIAYDGNVTLEYSGEKISMEYPKYFLNASGMSFLDYDYDGNIDVYISTWFLNYAPNKAYEQKMRDVLLKGNGDGTFTQIIDPAINKIAQPMYGVNVTDYNNDGWQDIITSPYCRSSGDIFKNNQNGTFSNAKTEANYTSQAMGGDHGQPLCQWEALPADFDRDGDMDLLQVSVHGGYDAGEGRTHISINEGEDKDYAFHWDLDRVVRDVPASYTHVGDMGGTWFDLDGDGLLECVICQQGYEQGTTNANGQTRTYFLKQDEDNYFHEITKDLGVMNSANRPHSAEPTDFDLDGDQDLVLSRQHKDKDNKMQSFLTLWENNIGNENYWSSIKVIAPDKCNKAAIGARIYLYKDGITQIQEIQSGLGHFSGSQPLIRNFGIGDSPYIDSIKVRFPTNDLKTITVKYPPANSFINIGQDGIEGFIFPQSSENMPIIAFDKSNLDFDYMKLGDSKQQIFNVRNLGAEDLNISNIEILNNEDEAYKIIDSKTEYIVKAGESIPITIDFSAVERITFDTYVKFTSDAFNAKAGMFRLIGRGYNEAPMITSLTDTLFLGKVLNGDDGEGEIRIRNIGENDLEISKIETVSETPNNFNSLNVVSKNDIMVIKSGDFLTFNYTVNPNAETDDYIFAALIIHSNSEKNAILSIPVKLFAITRKAYASVENIEDGALEFENTEVGSTSEKTVTIKSTGTKNLIIDNIEIKFDKYNNFAILDNNIPYEIESGESENFIIQFIPDKTKNYNKSLRFKTNAFDESEIKISLKGVGIPSTGISERFNNDLSLAVYPHPIGNSTTISIEIENTIQHKIRMSIIDVSGKIMKKFDFSETVAGEYAYELDCRNIPKGVYILLIQYGEKNISKTIVITGE